MKHKQGFTLIELLVIVAILAIFAAMAIPACSRVVRKGEIQKLRPNIVVSSELVKEVDRIKEIKNISDEEAVSLALGKNKTKKEPEQPTPTPDIYGSVNDLLPVLPPPSPEVTPETPPVAESEPAVATEPDKTGGLLFSISGVIIHKVEVHYGNGSKDMIDEYWFYVKKFDNSKSGLIFDGSPPGWLKVDQKVFQAKEAGQTYDATWKPTPEEAQVVINNS